MEQTWKCSVRNTDGGTEFEKYQLPYLKKHQRINMCFLRDALARKGRCLVRWPTDDNVSDIFTKQMKDIATFERHRESLGVVDLSRYVKFEGVLPPLESYRAKPITTAKNIVASVGTGVVKGVGAAASAVASLAKNEEARELIKALILGRFRK